MSEEKKYCPSVNEFDKIYDMFDYENIKKQILVMQKFTFGYEISVLIITDRLLGCAKGLYEYMQNSFDITVDLVYCLKEAKKIIDHKYIDFFIIVGYQKNEINYDAVNLVREYNKYASVIMYARHDAYTAYYCRKYDINEKYSRSKSINGLIEYMRICYSQKDISYIKENPDTTREQLWLIIKNEEHTADQLRKHLQEKKLQNKKNKEHRTKVFVNIGAVASMLFVIVILLVKLLNSQ